MEGKNMANDDKWKDKLNDEEYHVMRCGGTEPPFTGKYYKHNEKGEKLDRALEDAGSGEIKRDFLAFKQEEATRLKARHRVSLLSTKDGE